MTLPPDEVPESRVLGSPLTRLSDTPTSIPGGITVAAATSAHYRGISWPISGDATTLEGVTK